MRGNGVRTTAYVSQPENTGSEPVPAGEKPTTISRAEENACDLIGHVVYRDRGEKDPNK